MPPPGQREQQSPKPGKTGTTPEPEADQDDPPKEQAPILGKHQSCAEQGQKPAPGRLSGMEPFPTTTGREQSQGHISITRMDTSVARHPKEGDARQKGGQQPGGGFDQASLQTSVQASQKGQEAKWKGQ